MAALSGAAIIVFRAKGSRKETKETKETRGTFLCKQTNRQVDKRTSRRGSELHLESVFVFVVSSFSSFRRICHTMVVYLGMCADCGLKRLQ